MKLFDTIVKFKMNTSRDELILIRTILKGGYVWEELLFLLEKVE